MRLTILSLLILILSSITTKSKAQGCGSDLMAEISLDCSGEDAKGESFTDEELDFICGYNFFMGVMVLSSAASNMQGASNHTDPAYASLNNFSVSPASDIPFAQRFGLKTGLKVQRKGTKGKSTIDSFDYSYKVSLWYLELPVEGIYSFSLAKKHFIFGLGPCFGIGLASHEEDKSAGFSFSSSGLFSGITKSYKSGEIAASAELNVNVTDFIHIGIEAQIGLTNIYFASPFDKIHNKCFGIHAGYVIPFQSLFKAKSSQTHNRGE